MDAGERKLNLAEVTAIGIGGMIGGGIFAVLGLAIAQAGHAVPLTLAIGGAIALLTGLSYARLGLALRGDGGSFSYIEHAFEWPGVAAVAGWLLVAGYVGTLALYATAFGAYGATLLSGTGAPGALSGGLAALVLIGFLAINLRGAKTSGATELGIVAVKLAILAAFAVAGLRTAQVRHFQPLFDRGLLAPFTAAALIFVAYEGFELIPNAIDEMENPQRNLRRALVIAIVATTIVYVTVALAALGNLTPAQIAHDQEYVLAVAARPTMGAIRFHADRLCGAAVHRLGDQRHAVRRRAPCHGHGDGARAAARVLAARTHAPGALGGALVVDGGRARFHARRAARGHLDLRQRHLPADLLRHQPVGLAPAPAHRHGRHLAACRRRCDGAGFVLLMARTYVDAPRSLAWIAGVYAAAILAETVLTLLRGRRRVRRASPAR